MKKISLFTPCYNEEGNVYELYKRVTEVMKSLPQYDYEYIFIDNASTDNTAGILRKIAAEDKRVKVIINQRNFGPARSGAYGFYQTTGDVSICFACDFQDPPELIPKFIKKWEEGYKVVWGQKTGSTEKKHMKLFRLMYYKIVKSMADTRQYENVTGYGLYDREVVNLLKSSNDPAPNFRNMIGEYGFDVALIDYYQPPRRKGKSSYNFLGYLNVTLHSVITTTKLPLRICTLIGFATAMLSFFVGLVYLILKLIFWNSFNIGLAPVVIGVFFIGSVQLAFMGMIGEYVGEIFTRQMNHPLVIEKDRINFEDKN